MNDVGQMTDNCFFCSLHRGPVVAESVHLSVCHGIYREIGAGVDCIGLHPSVSADPRPTPGLGL